jgi:hypothetical protein
LQHAILSLHLFVPFVSEVNQSLCTKMESHEDEEEHAAVLPMKSNREKLKSVVDTTKERLRHIKGQVSNHELAGQLVG